MIKKRKKHGELTALKGIMLENKMTYNKLSHMLGIGVATLSGKINGFYAFNISEINKVINILDIEANDIAKYFFPASR